MEKLVIIPTFNEKDNIENIIRAVFGLNKHFHVLIIDDGSPDGTADIVKRLQNEFSSQLFLKERKGKLGLGTAYILGFKYGLEHQYQYIFEMDADFSHDPNDLERLYLACKTGGADVAVGSRYIPEGKVENWPADRIALSKGASLYTRIITGMPVKDPTAGFVCYTNKVLQSINLNNIYFVGYAFQIEMKFVAWKLGFKIVEVPITFKDRIFGASKMNKSIVKEGIAGVVKLKMLSRKKDYHQRVSNTEISGSKISPDPTTTLA